MIDSNLVWSGVKIVLQSGVVYIQTVQLFFRFQYYSDIIFTGQIYFRVTMSHEVLVTNVYFGKLTFTVITISRYND